MNREKLAWTLSVLLIAVLAFEVPQGLAQRDNDYAFVRTLVDIHRQVVNNYVEPVDGTEARKWRDQRDAGAARSVHHLRSAGQSGRV